jgi:hypothetical protein
MSYNVGPVLNGYEFIGTGMLKYENLVSEYSHNYCFAEYAVTVQNGLPELQYTF